MQIVAIGEDKGVDLCSKCGGVFLDFFDGDPGILAKTLAEHLSGAPLATNAAKTTERLSCPDCSATLNASLYGGDGPSLFRCPTCVGVFLRRQQFRELASYQETMYKDDDANDWLSKLLAAIRSLY